jgi:hypothetical protein
MPLAANAAQTLLATKTPCRIRNSPMKPFSVGKPIDDMVITRKTAAYTGMTFDSPPYSEISRVCRRS